MFVTDSMKLVHALPAQEQKAVTTLIGMKADEYLIWTLKENEELVMQTLHLVVSYEEGNRYRLYSSIAFAGNWCGCIRLNSCG